MAGWMNRKGRPWAGSSPEEGVGRKKPRAKQEGDPGASTLKIRWRKKRKRRGQHKDPGGNAGEMGSFSSRIEHDRYQGKRTIQEGGSEQL